MEYFDVVDENGKPTGEIVERKEAHAKGIAHRTSHVWIMRKKDDRLQILLQKRCEDKDSYPGCYDISSAGHIHHGDDYAISAIRELKEELGVEISPDELIDCGLIRTRFDEVFHGKEFHDKQVAQVYLLWLDREEEDFIVQKEEIDCVTWMDFEECKQAVRENSIPNCIIIEELKMLEKHIENS